MLGDVRSILSQNKSVLTMPRCMNQITRNTVRSQMWKIPHNLSLLKKKHALLCIILHWQSRSGQK